MLSYYRKIVARAMEHGTKAAELKILADKEPDPKRKADLIEQIAKEQSQERIHIIKASHWGNGDDLA